MPILPLCVAPHRALREQAKTVERVTGEIRRLARDLIDTMYANEGIGLAAPQVGRSLQLFVANPSQQRGRELVVLNPRMDALRGRASMIEGCLSVPNIWERVKRAARVTLRGLDLFGKPIAIEADGLLAIILQHEVDHLQGRLFIDRLAWLRRRRVEARLRAAACA